MGHHHAGRPARRTMDSGSRGPAGRARLAVASLGLRLAVVAWALRGAIEGAGLGFVANGREPRAWDAYVNLTYVVPLFAAVAALWSRRVTAAAGWVLAACAVWAAALVWRTGAFGAGAASAGPDLATVALRPGFSAIALLAAVRLGAAVPPGAGPAWLDRYFGDP